MPEPLLRLAGVRKEFPGGVVGLESIDLDIEAGEFLSLLGPSGCGKTTTLRVIAGFESPTAGRLELDGRDITALRPYDRPVNTVFQDYALFPHMNVAENIEFGLSLRKMPAAERSKRVAGALDMVGLGDKIRAKVSELSGGQRQRVALARAIVCEPRVLLLDEPLSALDAHLREQMQVELKGLQSRLGTTFVMVTHDQTEAMSISDRIVVMNRGRIEQTASPAELYDRPKTRFVASFIGTMNLLPVGSLGDGRLPSRLADIDIGKLLTQTGDIGLKGLLDNAGSARADQGVLIGIRPEDFTVFAEANAETMPARVQSVVFHGKTLRLHAEAGAGTNIVIDLPRQGENAASAPGTILHIGLRPGASCPFLPA
jgi:spermidine/putrescine transport system ATP-binding protein